MLARNLRTAAVLAADADAAIQITIFHALDTSPGHWAADGTLHQLHLPGAIVAVRMTSQTGRINPNTASSLLLRALLHNVGADESLSESVAAAIVQWRFPIDEHQPQGAAVVQYHAAGRDYGPPGAPFRSVEDVGLVLGMTPELLARLKPNLTIAYDRQPDPLSANDIVLHSLADVDPVLATPHSLRPDESVVEVTAAVTTEAGGTFVRRVIARIGERNHQMPFQILEWEDVAS